MQSATSDALKLPLKESGATNILMATPALFNPNRHFLGRQAKLRRFECVLLRHGKLGSV
jgi:hypothetical protein